MALVVLAANALMFLVAWERMSLSSCVLVATEQWAAATRQAALICLGATRVGMACLAGAFLWAHARTSSWAFTDRHLVGRPAGAGAGPHAPGGARGEGRDVAVSSVAAHRVRKCP